MKLSKFRFLKVVLFTCLLLMIGFRATAPEIRYAIIHYSDPVNAFERLIDAIVQVESSGDTLAYNTLEEATGAFQIRPIRIRDFNQRTGRNVKIEDCYNYQVSREIFLYYANLLELYDYELIAKNWNGSGIATIAYWEKVRSKLATY